MTRIKYATIGFARSSESVMLLRGKKEGQVGYRPTDDGPFSDPIYTERVVALPYTMTPTEYKEYIDERVGEDTEEPVTEALLEVADEKGIDTAGWAWNPREEGESA